MEFAGNWTEEEAEDGSCSGDIDRPSCYLSPTEVLVYRSRELFYLAVCPSLVQLGELDAVATIRMIVSCLSLIGALSVIISAILRREYFNPKVHPIFVLSIADTLLALFYIIGGIVWLRRESDVMSRVWCFAASLPTVILQCVTVNLTVLYAVLAYSGVRQKHFGNLLDVGDSRESVWSPRRTFISYIIVWVLPMAVVMVLFGAVVGDTGLLGKVDKCSCWCFPSLGNVVPYAHGRDEPTMHFRRDMRKVVISNATVIGTHFLVGFIVLVIVYRLIIKTIHRMRITARGKAPKSQYGATGATLTEAVLERAESLAKRRVVYFLLAFIVSGFFNSMLCYELMLVDLTALVKGEKESPSIVDSNHQEWWTKLYYITLCLQSLTISQQGFLNAIVYGWTREDFLHIMAVNTQRKKKIQAHLERNYSSSDSEEEEEEEEVEEEEVVVRRHSGVRDEHTFTHSLVDTDASGTDIEEVLEQST